MAWRFNAAARRGPLVALLLLDVAFGHEVARAQGVKVAVLPVLQSVAPGSEFNVEINVIQSGSGFDAFDAVVTYDPAALTYLPTTPVNLQEGCLMTGGCSGACGQTVNFVTPGADSIWVSDVLVCGGLSIAGPGELYHLKFRATATPQVTLVRLRRFRAYRAGYDVLPTSTADASVGVGVTLDAYPAPIAAGPPVVRAYPNPSAGPVVFVIEAAGDNDPELAIHDVQGRTVRVIPGIRAAKGAQRIDWDRRDLRGLRVQPGLYLVTLRAGPQVAHGRLLLVD
jgi:hypothetical protein